MKKRNDLIDSIRGFALVNMIFYHGLYDMVSLFGVSLPWFSSWGAHLWQQSIGMTFILVSGFTRTFAKNPIKNGLVVFSWGLLLTIFTSLFMPSQKIIFGILTLLGSSILITIFLEPFLQKISDTVGILLSFFLYLGTKNCSQGELFFIKNIIWKF